MDAGLGNGLHPLQWLTNNFMHSGFFHLAGNMIFLWTFGLVVEGKLGWWRFLLVVPRSRRSPKVRACRFLSTPQTPIEMLGASGVIFGLLAMCLVWAPHERGRLHHLASVHAECV